MSITDKTNRLVAGIAVVKENLITALQNKGVTVPPEAKLKDLPALVDSIEVGGGGGGDTPSVTYLYTVSGASNASANGDYYDTGETFNGAKTYTNGSCYIFYDLTLLAWYLSANKNNTTNAPIATCFSDDTTQVPTSGWNSGVTVSVYGGGSSGGGNGALFRVSGAGSTEANGDYFDTGETKNNLPIYKNENNIYMYFSTQCGYSWSNGWCLSPTVIDEGAGMLYCTVASNADTYPTNMLSNWSTLDGTTPVPVCRKLDENGNEIIPADYTVTGAGSPNVNGEYRKDGTHNGQPLYKNEKGTYLFYCLNAGQTVFGTDPNDEGSASWYYYHESYGGEIAEGDWETNATYPSIGGLGVSPYPTVTKN